MYVGKKHEVFQIPAYIHITAVITSNHVTSHHVT